MKTYSLSEANEEIRKFVEVYRRLQAAEGELILSRNRMTMGEVARFAADMTIVDLVSDDEWIVTLNGTGHCAHASVDRTGRNVLATCPPEERIARLEFARVMFSQPCGMFASLVEKFEDGAQAVVESISLPLRGADGMRKIVTYALVVEDIPEDYRERPTLSAVAVDSHRFLDLGHGIPSETATADT